MAADALSVRPDGMAEVRRDRAEAAVGSRIDERRKTVQVQLDRHEIVELVPEEPRDGDNKPAAWLKIVSPEITGYEDNAEDIHRARWFGIRNA